MFDPQLTYLRLAIVGAGLADAFVFEHVTGALIALVVIAIFELVAIADDRTKRKRALDDAVADAEVKRADDERRRRRDW